MEEQQELRNYYCSPNSNFLSTPHDLLEEHSSNSSSSSVHVTSGQCSECNKSFKTSALMRQHVRRIHTGKKPFSCSYCTESFRIVTELKEHLPAHIEEILANNLNQHMTIAHGAAHNKCFVCNMAFTEAESLKNHISLFHKGEKPYKCFECTSSFSSLLDMQQHLEGHNKEKPYGCSECTESFSKFEHLKEHIKVHSF